MSKFLLRDAEGELNIQVLVALIGAAATLAAALIAGIFGLIQLRAATGSPTPAPTTAPAPTHTPAPTLALLSVEIDGPAEAPLNEQTWFTIISEDAVRVEWTVAGFGADEIDPFERSDQIFVEPADAGRVGEAFTLVVTAYDADGNDASARHRFEIVEEE
jgi:hypothetical protein